ncbi:hypothetical protein AVENP_2094 [Arcobacter venerupis]|uniref:Uncharacterized protein n=1 Tax=Arcobacter venerupis TaxID=1054033 RepID=A0AAE7E3V4_9BACT|nr:hypothetical protein [Arcobacter venerupis]QKF67628.1 hypothetical protein AVENP_2094 [Arcobacter venerupis]RWS49213.1 hypothetical protein CKA56_10800 [Arcobacter venerupis]
MLEKLYKNSIDNIPFEVRRENLVDILDNFKNILEKEKLNNLNISVDIDEMQTKVKKYNAYAKILKDDLYEIVFCPHLLTLIDGLSIELTSKYKEYFSEINKSIFYDKNKRDILQKNIYQYLTNHIFYHELFHILRGHLKYVQNIKSLNIILEFEENHEKIVDNLYLEIDADKYASIASLLGSFEIFENIRKLGFNINEVFYIIFVSMNELLYIFHLLNKEPKTRQSHPILFDRTVLFNHYFMEALNEPKIKNVLEKNNVDYAQIDRLNVLSFALLTKKYQIEKLFNQNDILNLEKEYSNFLRNTKLDCYVYN